MSSSVNKFPFSFCARAYLLAALSLLGLAACGGGLDSSSDSVSITRITPSASTLDCGAAAFAAAEVSYSGELASSDLNFSWTQSSGTSVSLTSATTEKVYFTAPSSAGTLVLKLSLSANNVSDSATVSFTVSGSSCS